MQEVVIAGYLRTAQSRCRPNDPGRDWFYQLRADELLAKVLPELIKRSGVAPEEIDDFIVGSATGVGEQWTYGGRTPIFLANLPNTIAAKFVDQQCGSAMAGIHIGFMEIATGNADVVMVGGMEHMTRVPMGGTTQDRGLVSYNTDLFLSPAYKHWEMMTATNMGLTAEKLFKESGFTREDMDRWALRSHQRAAKALQEGYFKGEIMPIEVTLPDGKKQVIDYDVSIRPDTTLEALAQLRPAYIPDGQITAGNASPLNAGATALMLMSKEKAKEYGLKPLATIVSMGWAGVDPSVMGKGPVPASRMALRHAGLDVKDIDFWEINEAFAIVTIYAIRELGIDPERVNIKGGAIAIGHPLGASGNRLVGTLARILNMEKGTYGIATACVGGGQGAATLLKREDY